MFPISYPAELPICLRRHEIVEALRKHQVLVLAGETGSGKSTQLPKMCLEAGLAENGRIGCTQPRRVAALSVSRRVAEELGVTWGREVGCKIRFSDETTAETRVKFMTDGVLLAEIHSDPFLRAYSTLILDEAHERSLNIDFLLGYLRGLLLKRPELKLVITSATIDTGAFSRALGNAPVLEVSGRLYPVEIRYRPLESGVGEEQGPSKDTSELGLIDAAVLAVEDAFLEGASGDVLVFMPTERDIRDTVESLQGRFGSEFEILSLYGRLSMGDQQRIFAPGPKRRVIVATNIAETSITIPRIGVVIDSGLARISRYNPRNRTKRLPVEPVAQSSANQRAGRAGRLRDGLCIRLYSAEDYEKRPAFTQPEIQRANLAEVILRMKALRLGEVENFPFLNPPHAASIRAGYQLLLELGAVHEDGGLSAMGREMARLPVDPTLSRMLLQARGENVLPELLAIAAGLAVPDPRERPEAEKEAAAAAHARLSHPDSDFMGLLKIWELAPPVGERSSGNALRRFCRVNYLSYSRVREWRDLYRQLAQVIGETGARGTAPQKWAEDVASQKRRYEAIHRSVLSGLLGQVAMRKERNLYKASADRMVTLFPGSSLYTRFAKKGPKEQPGGGGRPPAAPGQPEWIVAGEVVETSQLFARTVARIDPLWVLEVGKHLCKFSYSSPQWSPKAGRVLALEKALIHGLELSRRQVDYGRINAVEATELFIRGALIAGEATVNAAFFAHNRALREKLEATFSRIRSNRLEDLDEAFYRFYAQRIHQVSSLHDLNGFLKAGSAKEADVLCATEADILGAHEPMYDKAMFPDQVAFGTTVIPLAYAYSPGNDHDGVTLQVPLPVAERLSDSELQWLVPGQRQEKIGVLLRSLPRGIRRQLLPLEPKVAEIAAGFEPGALELTVGLSKFIQAKYRVAVGPEDWRALPDYLRPRVEVVGQGEAPVASGRDLIKLRSEIEGKGMESDAWARAARKHERLALERWSLGDVDPSVSVEEIGGARLEGYPGLAVRTGSPALVDLKLFGTQSEAARASVDGVRRLAERVLEREIQGLHKQLRDMALLTVGRGRVGAAGQGGFAHALNSLTASKGSAASGSPGLALGSIAKLPDSACRHILNHLLRMEPVLPLSEKRFESMLQNARKELLPMAYRVRDLTRQILELAHAVCVGPKRYPGLQEDLLRLIPEDFLVQTPHESLPHLLRFLKAVEVRAERAWLCPAKDAEKAKQLRAFAGWKKEVPLNRHEPFRWLLEEFRVSIFAQELGTSQPVSVARLRALGGL